MKREGSAFTRNPERIMIMTDRLFKELPCFREHKTAGGDSLITVQVFFISTPDKFINQMRIVFGIYCNSLMQFIIAKH